MDIVITVGPIPTRGGWGGGGIELIREEEELVFRVGLYNNIEC